MEDYKALSDLRERYEGDVARVRADGDLTREARDERIRNLTRDFTAAYQAGRAELEQALEERHRSLYRAAHAPEEAEGDTQTELLREMRRQRVQHDLTDLWDRRGAGPTVGEYEEAMLRGDALELSVYEKYGARHVQDATHRQAFAQRAEEGARARMSPKRRQAFDELVRFERERDEAGHALAIRDATMRNMTRGNMEGERPMGHGRATRGEGVR